MMERLKILMGQLKIMIELLKIMMKDLQKAVEKAAAKAAKMAKEMATMKNAGELLKLERKPKKKLHLDRKLRKVLAVENTEEKEKS